MLSPPINLPSIRPAEEARTRTLFRRAIGLLLILYWLPVAARAIGKVGDALFVNVHPTLEKPGFLGYPDLFVKRLGVLDLFVGVLDLFGWFIEGGYALLVLALGLFLLRRRHGGPKWGESHE